MFITCIFHYDQIKNGEKNSLATHYREWIHTWSLHFVNVSHTNVYWQDPYIGFSCCGFFSNVHGKCITSFKFRFFLLQLKLCSIKFRIEKKMSLFLVNFKNKTFLERYDRLHTLLYIDLNKQIYKSIMKVINSIFFYLFEIQP